MSDNGPSRRHVLKSVGALGVGGSLIGTGTVGRQPVRAAVVTEQDKTASFGTVGETWTDAKTLEPEGYSHFHEREVETYAQFSTGIELFGIDESGNYEFVVNLHTGAKAADTDGNPVPFHEIGRQIDVPESKAHRYQFDRIQGDTFGIFVPNLPPSEEFQIAKKWTLQFLKWSATQLGKRVGLPVGLAFTAHDMATDVAELLDDYDQKSMHTLLTEDLRRSEIHAFRQFTVTLEPGKHTDFNFGSFVSVQGLEDVEARRNYTIVAPAEEPSPPAPGTSPGADLSVDGDSTVPAGSEVTFRFGRGNQDATVDRWYLEFADYGYDYSRRTSETGGSGQLPVYTGGQDGGTTETHRYLDPGSYSPRLTVWSESDVESTATTQLTVEPHEKPIADISASETSITVGDSVTFDASNSRTSESGRTLRYNWEVSGEPLVRNGGPEYSYTFAEAKQHQVTVEVVDDLGARATATVTIDVSKAVTRGTGGPDVELNIYRCQETNSDGECIQKIPTNEIATVAQPANDNPTELWLDATATNDHESNDYTVEWDGVDSSDWTTVDVPGPDNSLLKVDFQSVGKHDVTLTASYDEPDLSGSTSVTKTIEVSPNVTLEDSEATVDEETTVPIEWNAHEGLRNYHLEIRRVNPEQATVQPTVEADESGYVPEYSVTYREPGTYQLVLSMVTSPDGISKTVTSTVTVTEPDTDSGPSASLSLDKTTILPGEDVTVDASASEVGTEAKTYAWTIENESTEDPVSTVPIGERDTITLHQLGEHQITVTVKDGNGNTDSATADVVVAREPQEGSIVARIDRNPQSPFVHQLFTLDARRSYAESGIESYEWQIRRRNSRETIESLSEPRVTTSLEASADHFAELTVTDVEGNTATAEQKILVWEAEDFAARIDVSPEIPHVGDEVTFDASDSLALDGVDQYTWEIMPSGESRQAETITESFSTPGIRTMVLKLEKLDSNGDLVRNFKTEEDFYVAPAADPTASLSLSSTDITVGDEVTLDATGSSDDHEILTYDWSVRNESSGDELSELGLGGPDNTVSSWPDRTGTFVVEVTVTDVTDRTATATETVTVSSPPGEAPVATVDGPSEVTAGETVTFDGSSSSDPDGGSIQSYEWVIARNGTTVTTGAGATVDHAFERPGDHEVVLTVTDDEGATTTSEATVSVVLPPVVDSPPTDPDDDGAYEDINGNGRHDSDDVVTYFEKMSESPIAEYPTAFDFNGNDRVEFDDIVVLFEEL